MIQRLIFLKISQNKFTKDFCIFVSFLLYFEKQNNFSQVQFLTMGGSKSQSKPGAKKATAGSPAPKPSAAALKGISTSVKKPGAKDSRDKVFVKGHLSGIVVAYIVDGKHADREAFKAHDMSELHNDPDLLAQLGFNALISWLSSSLQA